MACMFAGWVPIAVYSGNVKDEREDCEASPDVPVGDRCDQLKDVESAMAATAVGLLLVTIRFYHRIYLDRFLEHLACCRILYWQST